MSYYFYLGRPDITDVTGLTVGLRSNWTDVTTINYIKLSSIDISEKVGIELKHKVLPSDKQLIIQLNKNTNDLTLTNWFIGSLICTADGEKSARFRTGLSYIKTKWKTLSNKYSTLFLVKDVPSATVEDEFGYNNIVHATNSKGWTIYTGAGFVRPKYSIQSIQFKVGNNLNLTLKTMTLKSATQ